MRYDPERHHRRSIRLRGYDYRAVGAYFITVVVQDRARLFGEVLEGAMRLNDAGRMLERWWLELNCRFPHVSTDAYVVMPNHFHGIVVIHSRPPDTTAPPDVGADLRVCPNTRVCPDSGGAHAGAPLPTIVQWFKTMTTNEYIRMVKHAGWTPFRGRLWQRNYYEHIIRNERALERIRDYILTNPLHWHLDRENTHAIGINSLEEEWFG